MHYIWKEWKENLNGKGIWLAFGLVAIVSLTLLFRSSSLSFEQGFYVLLINLFDALIYFIPVLCLLLSAFSVYQEKEQRTLVMLLTKGDHYISFLLKKSVAIQSVMIGPFLAWFLFYLLPMKFYFHLDLPAYGAFLLAIIAIIIVFTQIGIFIGSVSISKIQMIGISIGIWFYIFFIHDFLLLSLLPNISYDNVQLFSSVYFLNTVQAARIFLESSLGIYNFDHMSKLMQSFMWLKPSIFLFMNIAILVIVSLFSASVFHRKEGVE